MDVYKLNHRFRPLKQRTLMKLSSKAQTSFTLIRQETGILTQYILAQYIIVLDFEIIVDFCVMTFSPLLYWYAILLFQKLAKCCTQSRVITVDFLRKVSLTFWRDVQLFHEELPFFPVFSFLGEDCYFYLWGTIG